MRFDGNAKTSEVGFTRNIASCHYTGHIGYFKDNDEGQGKFTLVTLVNNVPYPMNVGDGLLISSDRSGTATIIKKRAGE